MPLSRAPYASLVCSWQLRLCTSDCLCLNWLYQSHVTWGCSLTFPCSVIPLLYKDHNTICLYGPTGMAKYPGQCPLCNEHLTYRQSIYILYKWHRTTVVKAKMWFPHSSYSSPHSIILGYFLPLLAHAESYCAFHKSYQWDSSLFPCLTPTVTVFGFRYRSSCESLLIELFNLIELFQLFKNLLMFSLLSSISQGYFSLGWWEKWIYQFRRKSQSLEGT